MTLYLPPKTLGKNIIFNISNYEYQDQPITYHEGDQRYLKIGDYSNVNGNISSVGDITSILNSINSGMTIINDEIYDISHNRLTEITNELYDISYNRLPAITNEIYDISHNRLTTITNRLDAMDVGLIATDETIAGIEGEIVTLQAEMVAVEAEVAVAIADVAVLNTAVTSHTSQISDINTKVDGVVGNVQFFTSKKESEANECFLNAILRLTQETSDGTHDTHIVINGKDKNIVIPSDSPGGKGGVWMTVDGFFIKSTSDDEPDVAIQPDGMRVNEPNGSGASNYLRHSAYVSGIIQTNDSFQALKDNVQEGVVIVTNNGTSLSSYISIQNSSSVSMTKITNSGYSLYDPFSLTNTLININNNGEIILSNNDTTPTNTVKLKNDGSISFKYNSSYSNNYDSKIGVINNYSGNSTIDGTGGLYITGKNIRHQNLNNQFIQTDFINSNLITTSIKVNNNPTWYPDAYVSVSPSPSGLGGDGNYSVLCTNFSAMSKNNQFMTVNHYTNNNTRVNFMSNGTNSTGSIQQNPNKMNDAYIDIVGGLSSANSRGAMVLVAKELDLSGDLITLLGDIHIIGNLYINGVQFSQAQNPVATNAFTIDEFYTQLETFQGTNPLYDRP